MKPQPLLPNTHDLFSKIFNEMEMEINFINNLETPLFVREPPLSTNPLITEQFFHEPPLCPNFKNKNYQQYVLRSSKLNVDSVYLNSQTSLKVT